MLTMRKLDDRIKLDGGKKLSKGKGFNWLQAQHKWLPKMPTEKEFDHPNGKGKTYFNYDQKLKDILSDMVQYVSICKMLRTGMFKTHSDSFCEEFYFDLVAETFLKIHKGIHNWNLKYDVLRFVQCMVNFGWLSLWTKYKTEQKVIKGVLDPNLSISFIEASELFEKYDSSGNDEQMSKLMSLQMNEMEDSVEDIQEIES